MISKDDLLTSEFLKQFRDSKDFNSFLEELYVRGTERMLEAGLDQHLGYEKHAAEGRNSGNSRNGKT
ncbi:transposase, partial [Pontibacter silvestris]